MSARTLALTAVLVGASSASASGQDLFAAAEREPNYERYSTPAACVAAVKRFERRQQWGRSVDTLPYDKTRTLPPAAARVAERCLVRFRSGAGRPDSTTTRDAPALFRLAAMAGDDALVGSSVELTLSEQRLRADSLDLLFTAVGALAMGRPVQLGRARSLAARLDSLGAVGERASGWWMSQHQFPLHAALAELDRRAIAAEAAGLLDNIAALPDTARTAGIFDVHVSGMQALLAQMLPALDSGAVDSAVARLIKRAETVLSPEAMAASPLGAALPLVGKPAPPLSADFWYGRPPGDSLLPRRGRVTLVQYVDPNCNFCDYAVLRRLKQRFGDRLDLVLLTETRGFFRTHPPLRPEKEAELVGQYYTRFHRMPAIVGVSTTPFTRHPAPDRRRVDQKVPAVERYRYGAGALLVDTRGKLTFPLTNATARESEAFVGRLIEALLRQP